jgi:hypothetical protein
MVKDGILADNTILSNFILIEREDILNKIFKNKFFTMVVLCGSHSCPYSEFQIPLSGSDPQPWL